MKRKISLLLTPVLCILIMFITTGCTDKEQEECISSFQNGLESRWEITNTDPNSYKEQQQLTTKGIDKELEIISKYKDKQFENEDFGKTVKQYIAALEKQKEGIPFYIENADKYEKLFNEQGFDVRSKCIKKLVDNYGLKVEEKYDDTLQQFLKGNRIKMINPGERVTVDTQYGKVNVAVDKAVKNDFFTKSYLENKKIEKNKCVGVICFTIKNISYIDQYNTESMELQDVLTVSSMDIISINPLGEGYDYSNYSVSAGGYFDIKKGERKRVVSWYVFENDNKMIHVNIGNQYETFVKINQQ